MTSKISYFKFIRENIRRRSWLAAVSAILIFSVQTLWTSIRIESLLADPNYSSLDSVKNFSIANWTDTVFPGFLNGSAYQPFAILIILLALCCAVSGFSYLHKTEETDFFHSLPLTRRQLFSISYIGGLLIFLLPYLIASIATISIASAMGLGSYIPLGRCLLAILGCILGFLIFYHTSIFAMMLTGKLISGVLASFVFYVYIEMVAQLFESLPSLFWDTYHSTPNSLSDQIPRFLSPLSIYSHLLTQTAYTNDSVNFSNILLTFVIAVLYGILTFFIAYILYQKRPSEAAGNALTYQSLSGWIKFFATVPAALNIGLFVSTFYGHISTKWIIFSSILAVVILCGITEFIYHTDLRQITKGKRSSFFSLLTVAGILCILHFDLFGYNTWIPENEDLKSVSVTSDSFTNYFIYQNNTVHFSYDTPLDNPALQVTDPAPVLLLAEEGIQNYKNGIKVEDTITETAKDYIRISIRFTRKYGSPVYRDYVVSKNTLLNTLETLCKSEDYRKGLFPVFQLEIDKMTAVDLTDIYQTPQTLSLTSEQKTALFDAYKEDVLHTDIRTLQEEYPIAELTAKYPALPEENLDISTCDYVEGCFVDPSISQLYIYKNFKNTRTLLTEYGYTIRENMDPSDVSQIQLELLEDSSEKAEPQIISDPEQIQLLLNQIHYNCSGILGGKDTSMQYVQIQQKEYPYPYYYPLVQ